MRELKNKMFQRKKGRAGEFLEFEDSTGTKCTLSPSSVGNEIWLGTKDPNPQQLGAGGWIKYQIPKDILVSHKMRLSRKQGMLLGLKLIVYAASGRLWK